VAQQGGKCKWGHTPQGTGLGCPSTHFIQTFKKNEFFRNVGQNMPKMCIFRKKNAVKLLQRPGLPPHNPL